ncbi:hypothetical protein MBM09_08305 [Flaviramulus sp. BrNp1-15]|uniref:hypothetical protein n=1 Tax=Flaviramulus sp. BrNp1-15 TaxID=2916754 RepID=UPI001EE7D8EE|nr:hypothetical protein [Flaviramulus sp. BrNp1-15]ULC57921.1 hypothetical protein MBM09_08305 [Flaviramulus sp. BrNp1-15]
MKNLNKIILGTCLVALLSYSNIISAQQEIIPPSPTAQNFMRYGEIPVDYSTGVPNISIPICTVEGRKLSFPITLSYHASGIKVEDVSSEVGLGWVLNAGGLVARTIMGERDEKGFANKTYDDAQHLLDTVYAAYLEELQPNKCFQSMVNLEYWFRVQNQFDNEDPMSDRFFYKLPNGTSGVFRYDYTYQNLITLPNKPIKINISNTSNNILSITIKDDDGTSYNFNHKPPNSSFSGISEWYLTEVKSADDKDTITFHYAATDQVYQTSSVTYTAQSESIIPSNCSEPASISSNAYNPNKYAPVLDSIVSSKSVVRFSYQSDREDFPSAKRLSEITVSPAGSPTEIIKHISLNNDIYFGTTVANKRLRLNSVDIRGKQVGSDPQTYSFVYENSTLPDYRANGGMHNEDFWGYYNSSNSGFNVPSIFITESYHNQSYGSDRKAHTNNYYAKSCMLKEISYPTGGKTVFDFERHYAANSLYPTAGNTGGYVGGFRVKSITNYKNGNEIADVKTYKYGSARYQQVRKENFAYWQKYYGGATPSNCNPYTLDLVFSSPLIPLEVAPGMPIMYREVVEYNGTLANHAGKTIYKYEEPFSQTDFIFNDNTYAEYEHPRFWHPNLRDKGNYTPKMTSKKVYELNNGTYYPVLEDRYVYSDLFATTYHMGIKLTRSVSFLDIPEGHFCFYNMNEFPTEWAVVPAMIEVKENFLASFKAMDTEAIQEASLLTSMESYTYASLDSTKYVLTTTDYTYNQTNVAVSEQTITNSKGEMITTTFKYPHDYGSQPYLTMADTKNILSPIIEQSTYKGNVSEPNLLSRTKTDYKDWGNNIILPEYLKEQKGTSAIYSKIEFVSYDTSTGNLTEYKQMDSPTITYLWGYNRQYPVAKVENATLAAVTATLTPSELNDIRNGTYSQSSMITALNKIRSGLPDALVTTYTYDPLVGITSMTDPKGYLIYYEYDSFNRLEYVRDAMGNIFSKTKYHYKE